MQHSVRTAKVFADKFNSKLNDLEVPNDFKLRIQLVAKMLHVSPDKVRIWLNGYQLPSEKEMNLIINEFGFDSHWLKGDEQVTHH